MKIIEFKTKDKFQEYIHGATDLGHSKTFLKKNKIIKLFYTRGIWSSAFLYSYSDRMIINAKKLKILDFHSIDITEKLIFKYSKRISGVSYKKIPGETLRDLIIKRRLSSNEIKKIAQFISLLHEKGIYFRSMHFGNIILKNTFFLIDIAKIHFFPWSLWVYTRARAFRRLFKYKDDLKNIGNNNLNLLINHYIKFSGFNLLQKKIFLITLNKINKIRPSIKTKFILFLFILFAGVIFWIRF